MATFWKTGYHHRQFSINFWAGILGNCLIHDNIFRIKLVAVIILNFFEHTLVGYWVMCPSTCVFTCGFNTTTLHHVTIVERVSGCPEIVLDAGMVVGVKLKFSELHAHLT
jgi:hypothetical protein